jgi:hypothetical protein
MVPIAALPEYPDGATLKQTLLFLEAYPESQMLATPAERAAYFKKKEEQLQISRPGSYDVVLRSTGIAHPSFSDIPLLFAGYDGYPRTEIVLHNHDLIEVCSTNFSAGISDKKRLPRWTLSTAVLEKQPSKGTAVERSLSVRRKLVSYTPRCIESTNHRPQDNPFQSTARR